VLRVILLWTFFRLGTWRVTAMTGTWRVTAMTGTWRVTAMTGRHLLNMMQQQNLPNMKEKLEFVENCLLTHDDYLEEERK
jgi:hypothetical protein